MQHRLPVADVLSDGCVDLCLDFDWFIHGAATDRWMKVWCHFSEDVVQVSTGGTIIITLVGEVALELSLSLQEN